MMPGGDGNNRLRPFILNALSLTQAKQDNVFTYHKILKVRSHKTVETLLFLLSYTVLRAAFTDTGVVIRVGTWCIV